MARLSVEIGPEAQRQMDRLIREGWYPDAQSVVSAALEQFLEGRTYIGDSPGLLLRFAADALNESKPDTALKFAERGLMLLGGMQEFPDRSLYQSLVEIRVQALLVLDREADAVTALEEAKGHLPNHPGIAAWFDRLQARRG
jgi:Arc/MetJ-type ribon-helix-helix transcriptional regulator